MVFLLQLFFVIVFGILVWLFTSRIFNKSKPYPPGPWGIPILGNLLSMGSEPFKTFIKWKEVYGPIFSIQLGSYPAIVLNDEKTIKLAFGNPTFAGRPLIPLFIDATNGRGFASCDGPELTIQRRFVDKSLRKFLQRDKEIMETKMLAEIKESLVDLREKSGKIIQMNHLFQRYIINAIWSLLIGTRFETGDPQLLMLTEGLNKIARFDGILTKLSFVVKPVSQFIPEFSGYNNMVRGMQNINNFMGNQFEKGSRSRIPGNPTNYTESYMDQIDITVDTNSSFHKLNHYYKETTGELFLAVMETLSSTIDFFFIHMLRYPKVFKAAQAEIHSVVGTDRQPNLDDRPHMPYTQASIQECLRFSPIIPLSIYHRTIEDTCLQEYFIPKDTIVISNLYAANHDSTTWGDPEAYRPERFLDEKTGGVKKIDSTLSFSYGKRICPGESLAKDFLFLYIANILQQFNVSIPTNSHLPSLETIPGMVFSPKNYNIVFTTRKLEENR